MTKQLFFCAVLDYHFTMFITIVAISARESKKLLANHFLKKDFILLF